jgi:hypothetical protein
MTCLRKHLEKGQVVCETAITHIRYLMQRPYVITASVISGLAVAAELRSIKVHALFFGWINSAPIATIFIVTFIFLILNIKKYLTHKELSYFTPFIICIYSLFIMISYKNNRDNLDTSATSFTAHTLEIGSDGGFKFDFKKNGHLVAERMDHWKDTRYWGKYYRNNDTITLDIPLNFKLGKRAILTDTSLNFIDDTIKFNAYKWTLPTKSNSIKWQ